MALLANDRTLVFTPRELDEKEVEALLVQLAAKKTDGILSDALAQAQTHDVVAGVNVVALEHVVLAERFAREKEFAPFLLLLKARTATLTADVGQTVKGKFVLSFLDAETAKLAAPAIEDGMTLLAAEFARSFKRSREDGIERTVIRWGLRLWKSTSVTADGTNVVVAADVPFADDLAKLVQGLPQSLKQEFIDTTTSNNLKQLGLAMPFHHDAQRLPGDVGPATAARDELAVQLLPYIEQNALQPTRPHEAVGRPEEPEGSPGGRDAEGLRAPRPPRPKGHTYFRVFTLPKDAKATDRPLFREGERGPTLLNITDGTSNTFMIVEAGEAVPWYKPDVLAYDGKLPLPQLGDKEADAFLVAFCDGSVRKLKPSKLGEKTLRALITINGGEVVEIPE